MPNCGLALALIVAPLAFVTPRFVNAQTADLIVTNARRAVYQKPIQ